MSLDPVTLAVLKGRLEQIADENALADVFEMLNDKKPEVQVNPVIGRRVASP